MKRLAAVFLLLLCLTACGSKVDLMPNASPETSALCLTIYDGETITRQYLFETDVIREKALRDFRNAKANPAEVDLTTLQPPYYGLEIGGTDGYSVCGLWSDGCFIMGDGSTYAFDYDFTAFQNRYTFEEPEQFSTLTVLPCVDNLAKLETGWNSALLSPAETVDSQQSVTMELTEQTESHLVVAIHNHSDTEWGYGHAFHLEVQLDDGWYRIPAEQEIAFTEELLIVEAGDTAQERCWIEPYGTLPPGTYRLVLQGMTVSFHIA